MNISFDNEENNKNLNIINIDKNYSNSSNDKNQISSQIFYENTIPEKMSICPWIKKNSNTNKTYGMIKLHHEILDFYNFIKLTENEKYLRQKSYDSVKSLIEKKFECHKCEIFGSFALDFSIPNSDIDIIVIHNNDKMNDEKNLVQIIKFLESVKFYLRNQNYLKI